MCIIKNSVKTKVIYNSFSRVLFYFLFYISVPFLFSFSLSPGF